MSKVQIKQQTTSARASPAPSVHVTLTVSWV